MSVIPRTLADHGPAMSESGTWFAVAGHDVPFLEAEHEFDVGLEVPGRNGWVRHAPEFADIAGHWWVECDESDVGAEPATIWDTE